MKLCKALVRGLGSSSRQYSNPISNTQRRSCIIERNPTTEDDWVILGHIDRAMPFEPTKDLGPSVLRAETEMYHLYRKIKDGDADWLEMVDLFCCCDQELVSTAYMWSMYLEVIPTLFGAKREFARLFHYHHQFDISVFNALLKQFVSNGSFLEAGRLWQKSILRSNKLITEPNVHTLNIMLDMVLTPSPEEEEWWLDRGVLFVPSERKRASFFRPKILDSVSTKKLTTGDQFNMVGQCFQAIERYKIEPDFTTLYLMARVIRVEIDYGRHIASQICMYMETLNDDVVCILNVIWLLFGLHPREFAVLNLF